MKILCTLIVFLIGAASSYAQDTTYVYRDKNGKKTNEVNYHALEKIFFVKDSNYYRLLEYSSEGQLQMSGQYTDKELSLRTGEFTYYYNNGNKKFTSYYVDDKMNGVCRSWFYNGQLKSESRRTENDSYLINAWDSLGREMVADGNGYYYSFYSDPVSPESKGKYEDGVRDSTWIYYYRDSTIKNVENWVKGELTRGIFYSETGEYEYTAFEEQAAYPGGMSKLYEYIHTTVQYPKEAREMGIEGKVYVEFVIWKDGSIRDVVVKRGAHPDLDQEALRVISMMPNWEPGRQRGAPVNSRFILPINFSLGLKKKKEK